jgi:hypothetical protein
MGKAIIIRDADFSQVAVASNTIPVTGLAITGASGTQTQRQVQLSVSYTPADTTQLGVVWSVISGNATITSDGLLTYNGSTASASVVVKATSSKNSSVYAQATVSFALPAIEAPTFSPAQGTYSQAQSVALSCGTAGATIYYTTNGSTPTTSSSVYSSPIAVAESMTIKAIAVKNGQSSEVATASYVITVPRTVTVTVTDGTNPVSGAVVTLGGNTPTSSSGGTYVFTVPDGTYTLSVSKEGFVTHTESMTISANTSKTVVLGADLLRYAILGNANIRGHTHNPIMATIMPKSADTTNLTNDGAYIQFQAPARSSIIIARDNATDAVTWQTWKRGDNLYSDGVEPLSDVKDAYSLVEWPLDVDEIEIKLTNSDYWIGGRIMDADNTNLVQYTAAAYDQGGANCVYRLSRSNYPNAFYIAIWFKYQSAGTSWPNPTLETLGLSVTAVAD